MLLRLHLIEKEVHELFLSPGVKRHFRLVRRPEHVDDLRTTANSSLQGNPKPSYNKQDQHRNEYSSVEHGSTNNLSSTPVLVFVIGEHGDVIAIVCQSAEPGRM